jgi:hypothetical protein
LAKVLGVMLVQAGVARSCIACTVEIEIEIEVEVEVEAEGKSVAMRGKNLANRSGRQLALASCTVA